MAIRAIRQKGPLADSERARRPLVRDRPCLPTNGRRVSRVMRYIVPGFAVTTSMESAPMRDVREISVDEAPTSQFRQPKPEHCLRRSSSTTSAALCRRSASITPPFGCCYASSVAAGAGSSCRRHTSRLRPATAVANLRATARELVRAAPERHAVGEQLAAPEPLRHLRRCHAP